MVNEVARKNVIPKLAENVENSLKVALRKAAVPEHIVQSQRLVLAGLREEPLAINKEEDIDWNNEFFYPMPSNNSGREKTCNYYSISIWKIFLERLY